MVSVIVEIWVSVTDSPPAIIEVVLVKRPVIFRCLIVLVSAMTNSRNDLGVETRSKADILSTATR